MTLESDLQKLGFKENEALVYVAVLELGEPLVGEIEKQTGLHKQIIYNAAERLFKDGLLSIHEINGRKRFSIPNPAALEESAFLTLQRTQQLIPQLFEHANKKRSAENVRVYRGKKGVQHYYAEAIQYQPKGSELDILGINSMRFFDIFERNEAPFQAFEQTRSKKQVFTKLLLFGNSEEEILLNTGRKYLELRTLPDAIEAPNDIMIWDDRVGFLFYGEEPYVLDLVGEQTVIGFRQYFSVLWDKAQLV